LGLNIYVGSKLAQLAHNGLKVGSYIDGICKHIAKATQADHKPKLWQRACKSEAKEF